MHIFRGDIIILEDDTRIEIIDLNCHTQEYNVLIEGVKSKISYWCDTWEQIKKIIVDNNV